MVACSACGAQLGPGVSFCSGCGRPITAFAMPVADPPRGVSVKAIAATFTVAVLSISFLYWIVASSENGARAASPQPDTAKLSPVASKEEVTAARSVGLSPKFIDGAWAAADYIQELYTREAFGTGGLSDEAAKSLLSNAKGAIKNDRDRRAWNVLHSLLWDLHIAPTFKGSPKYKRYMNNGEDCFMGTRIAFGMDKPEGDFKNAISECMAGQATLKTEIDKVRIVKWDEY